MSNITKRAARSMQRVGKAKQPPAPPHSCDYEPSLVHLEFPAIDDAKPFTDGIPIIQEISKWSHETPTICRIIVDQRFTKEAADKIVVMMHSAPTLWRALRRLVIEAARGFEDSTCRINAITEAWKVLSETAMRDPMREPEPDPEEYLLAFRNVPGIDEMPDKRRNKIIDEIEQEMQKAPDRCPV
jgi:hypothetical protein